MMPTESATVIGRSTKVHGELSGSDDLLIDGEVEGTIHLTAARLTVRAEGRVRASITAQDVIVIGRVEGEIRATGRVELRDGAVVLGDIFANRLSIEEGASLLGHVDPSKASELAAEGKTASDTHSGTTSPDGQ
jgi:cytoskeletal protein CcmA (bactofilin family)